MLNVRVAKNDPEKEDSTYIHNQHCRASCGQPVLFILLLLSVLLQLLLVVSRILLHQLLHATVSRNTVPLHLLLVLQPLDPFELVHFL